MVSIPSALNIKRMAIKAANYSDSISFLLIVSTGTIYVYIKFVYFPSNAPSIIFKSSFCEHSRRIFEILVTVHIILLLSYNDTAYAIKNINEISLVFLPIRYIHHFALFVLSY
jgi:hypothetical protein